MERHLACLSCGGQHDPLVPCEARKALDALDAAEAQARTDAVHSLAWQARYRRYLRDGVTGGKEEAYG